MRPTLWLSASEMPGLNSMEMVNVPSLKGGRKDRGSWVANAAEAITPASAPVISVLGCRNDHPSRLALPRFSTRTTNPSCSSRRFSPGSM